MTYAVPADPLDASPGFFKTRLVAKGPYVPARLWKVEDRDEAGDLCGDTQYFAEVNGESADAFNPPWWPWRVITQQEFDFMTADAAWAREHAPDEAIANPNRPMTLENARMF